MAEQNLGDAVRRLVFQVLTQEGQAHTHGHLIIQLHANHPPNEQWPQELQTVQENQLDDFLHSDQGRIVRYQDDANRLPGNPYWYAVRQGDEPRDTFNHPYRRGVDGTFYRKE